MKCPNCGADIKDGSKTCEFCDSSITADMKREQEYVNKVGCPKCGSSNITFSRETQGAINNNKKTAIVRSTVGMCKDCGYTWNVNDSVPKKKSRTWLWVLGWIFIFPLPLTVLLLRKKEMKPVIKYGIIAVAWIFYLIIALGGKSSVAPDSTVTNDSAVSESKVYEEKSHIYDDVKVIDLMNGYGTEKIGTITVTKVNQSKCTDDALIDWYFNYVKNNSDNNYHLIVYKDNPHKGVYTLGSGFIQKDVALNAEDNGSYKLGDDAGSTYYTVDETSKTLNLRTTMADSVVIDDVKSKVDAVIPADYKNSDLYSVDVAGEEGSLDCNLTLVNKSFADDRDCQNVAVELAAKIKKLDLGIGYFCIAFQSDDNTMTAVSNIDDLSSQDVSNISTKKS